LNSITFSAGTPAIPVNPFGAKLRLNDLVNATVQVQILLLAQVLMFLRLAPKNV